MDSFQDRAGFVTKSANWRRDSSDRISHIHRTQLTGANVAAAGLLCLELYAHENGDCASTPHHRHFGTRHSRLSWGLVAVLQSGTRCISSVITSLTAGCLHPRSRLAGCVRGSSLSLSRARALSQPPVCPRGGWRAPARAGGGRGWGESASGAGGAGRGGLAGGPASAFEGAGEWAGACGEGPAPRACPQGGGGGARRLSATPLSRAPACAPTDGACPRRGPWRPSLVRCRHSVALVAVVAVVALAAIAATAVLHVHLSVLCLCLQRRGSAQPWAQPWSKPWAQPWAQHGTAATRWK